MHSLRTFGPAGLPTILGLALIPLLVAACPEPPKPRPRPRRVAPPSYPYRGKTLRLDGRIQVIDRTKTRAIGVKYETVTGGLQKPVALVGLDVRRGRTSWTKPVALKLRDPNLPWSIEVSRNITYLAAWVEGDKIKCFDIYGRDAWTAKVDGLMGVAKLGEGFVSAKGSQIYFLDRANGRASAVADLGAPITAPLLVLDEGEVVALTGDHLVGINLDAPKGKQILFRHRLKLEEGLVATKPEYNGDVIVVGSKALPIVIKTEVSRLDPQTLKPKWKRLIPGRVRTHDSIHLLDDQIRIVNRMQGEPDYLYKIKLADGQLVGKIKAKVRRGCHYGSKLLYCITKTGLTAYDRRNLRKSWERPTLDDVTSNKHLAHGSTYYLAEGPKVVGLTESGRVNFTFEIKLPPSRALVNRVLGVIKDTLIITVADWVHKPVGEVWGVSLKTGKRLWRKKLLGPAYSERSVQLIGDRVLFANTVWMTAIAAVNGRLLGRWPHRLRAKKVKITRIETDGKAAWAVRAGQLALLNPKTGKASWQRKLEADRIIAVGPTLMFLKTPEGAIKAIDLNTAKERWKVPFDLAITPKIVEVPAGVIISHHKKGLLVDREKGTITRRTTPGGWHLQLFEDTPLMVRVLAFQPKSAGLIEAVKYTRATRKVARIWRKIVTRPSKVATPLTGAPQGLFPWYRVSGDMVLFPIKGGRCLAALDLEEGGARWKECKLAWLAPPRAYRGQLYTTTGPWRDKVPAALQGLFRVSEENGKLKQLFKVPKQGEDRHMWPQYGRIKQGEYFTLTQGDRLRQIFLAAPLKRN